MKIILDDKDINFIDRVNECFKNNEDFPFYITPAIKKVSLTFEIKDAAKANAFINYFMLGGADRMQELEELGIAVISLDYKDTTVDQMKQILQNALNQLDQL